MNHKYVAAIILSSLLCASPAFAGKPKKHPQKQPPPPARQAAPAPATTSVTPNVLPSASLAQFLDAHLDRILAPLDTEGLKHPELIADFTTSVADAGSKAVPGNRPAFQAALAVCGALTNALNERTTTLANF